MLFKTDHKLSNVLLNVAQSDSFDEDEIKKEFPLMGDENKYENKLCRNINPF